MLVLSSPRKSNAAEFHETKLQILERTNEAARQHKAEADGGVWKGRIMSTHDALPAARHFAE
ncbi:hypothetical protein E2C01_074315 [Portunus trituberculatus]|uniref:Uncharacterized protein n=1 Tax=Portunus trituberculatus TaxID=210409 RepID=A0A5B7ICZ3_PORTR|nr:hypothetical protein [Portunus trituberculatus]